MSCRNPPSAKEAKRPDMSPCEPGGPQVGDRFAGAIERAFRDRGRRTGDVIRYVATFQIAEDDVPERVGSRVTAWYGTGVSQPWKRGS